MIKHTVMLFVAALMVFVSQSFLMAQTNTFPPDGNVGIGTTTPTSKLHIVGPAPADANDAQLAIVTPNGNLILLGRADAYGFLQSHNREPLALNPLGNNVGIGTTSPGSPLTISGVIESTSGGIKFPDGTIQTTAQLRGPQGPQGPQGDPGPPTQSIAVCQSGAPISCACEGSTVTRVFGTCSVTSDTGPWSNNGPGCCAVCSPD